jgi:NAD(P) transhydrogenase
MSAVVESIYILCSILFVFSLGNLSQIESATRGNLFAMTGMTLAILFTFALDQFHLEFAKFFPPFLIGSAIGLLLAKRAKMISMPQLVAILHAFVGLAASLVGLARAYYITDSDDEPRKMEFLEIYIGIFIGVITFVGSVIAWGKLEGKIRSAPLLICGKFRHAIHVIILLLVGVIGIVYIVSRGWKSPIYLMGILAIYLGFSLIMAIGGADMPVVISMLNSYSGWATSANGFMLENNLLIIVGALVGSSGAILSYIMCKAMNRSFFSVIAGGFGNVLYHPSDTIAQGVQVETSAEEAARELMGAKTVVIVPGYGMAVAKAQHVLAAVTKTLRSHRVKVRYCIHPVAGRLPGHMNVLLAEANVPYELVAEMEAVNKDFENTDVVLVVGANDIVNPDALDNPQSPIAGMPVCEVWKAKRTIVFKRGSGTGYAGVDNALFTMTNTRMYFGSADSSLNAIHAKLSGGSQDYDLSFSSEEADPREVEIEMIGQSYMSLGVIKETKPLERRVAVTPNTVRLFRKQGFDVQIERGAGLAAGFSDDQYVAAGAHLGSVQDVLVSSQVLLKVGPPQFNEGLGREEADCLERVSLLVCYIKPAENQDLLAKLSGKYPELTVIAMDCVPRITRAQKLDSLSSMGSLAGYRAVVEALNCFSRCPRAHVTAAGSSPPARVFVIGAGVAGLAAISYCKSIGCIVKAYDTRPAAREQVESFGAEFLEVNFQEEGTGFGGYARQMSSTFLEAQVQMTRKVAKSSDIIITTALIPGRPAPRLIPADIVREMKPGSVIVDLAAEMGGNCELTRANEAYVDPQSGVVLIGFTDLVSRMATQSSEMYAVNLSNCLEELGGAAHYHVNLDNNEVLQAMVVLHKGKVTWAPVIPPIAPPPSAPVVPEPTSPLAQDPKVASASNNARACISVFALFVFFLVMGATGSDFLMRFGVFVLAIFVGYMVVWRVTPALHTPLMSVTNAISGIVVVGAMLSLENADKDVPLDACAGISVFAVFFASINITGGFYVTHRMLKMFTQERRHYSAA